ncbi:aspartate aminotransferase family protein [Frankia sp. Cr1]|uniref:aminotransferase family protein n=1 Tax=Frankia sp. Cr1 TaxID=3073931 RepID=UPI002AD412CD|nr:aminotransferase class III-fold pyridoxal phosphate-dependent enzyme [Frankia sp. Cr1]
MKEQTLQRLARAHMWYPWSPTRADGSDRLVIVAGEGCDVVDIHGCRYLDAKSCQLNASVGYGHPRVVAAITAQIATLMTYDLVDGVTEPAVRLAARIAGVTDGLLSRTFFCGSGSEATETAVKMARMFHALQGEPERRWVLSLADGYHGATLAALSLTDMPMIRTGNNPIPEGFASVPTPRCGDCANRTRHQHCRIPGPESLAETIETIGAGRVAAFIMEPVLGVGGLVIPPAGYLEAVREICDEFGVLLIFDEVMTGFGRTGRWFAHQHAGIIPDILTSGKGLTGGYLPLAAVTTRPEIYDVFAGDALLGGFRHGHTMAGHATACTAGLAVLDIVDSDGLVNRSARLGADLLTALTPLRRQRWVHDVRGVGLLIGIEVDTVDRAVALSRAARDAGVLLRQQGPVLTVAPPLIVTESQAARIAAVLASCVAELETRR